MKTIIVEDERNSLIHLKKLTKSIPEIELVGYASSAKEAADLIYISKPDLLLLDIELPDNNAFELLHSLRESQPYVIFTTGFTQYGIQAVKCAALDYLLKPVKLVELAHAISKALKRKETKEVSEQIQHLLSIVSSPPKEHRIAIQLMNQMRFINPGEIVHLEAANNYTQIFLQSGEKILASKGLYEFDDILTPYGFIRCHQSHLVNRHFIKSLLTLHSITEIELSGNRGTIPVSRLKKELVKNVWLNPTD